MLFGTHLITKHTLEQPRIFMESKSLEKETTNSVTSRTDDSSDDDMDRGDDASIEASPDESSSSSSSSSSRVRDIVHLSSKHNVPCSRELFLPTGPPPPPRETTVKFDSVEVREYPIIPGDNPSCRGGPPLTIGWEPTNRSGKIAPLEDFECLRSSQRRDDPEDLVVSSSNRTDLLKFQGFSRREIKKAATNANTTRNQRSATHQHEKAMAPFRQLKDRTLKWLTCRECRKTTTTPTINCTKAAVELPLRINDLTAAWKDGK